MNYPVPPLARQTLADWAEELAERLKRPLDEIISKGLSALAVGDTLAFTASPGGDEL